MVACAVEKIVTITPVWRAEKHNTVRHLNECRQMDIEIAFANAKVVMHEMEGAVKYDYIANQAKIDEMRKNFQLSMALIEGHLSTIVYMEGGVLSRLFVAGVIGAVTYIAAERHNIKKK